MKLKIIESYREELTTKGIVVCTYLDMQNNDVDCINLIYEEEYQNFEIIEVQENNINI